MTRLDEMTNDEIWGQIGGCFYGIHKDVENRCYPEHSRTGARHLQCLVREHLAWIDRALLEIEMRRASKARKILRRVEEGMTTVADAEFLREILGIKAEKVVPDPGKWPFG